MWIRPFVLAALVASIARVRASPPLPPMLESGDRELKWIDEHYPETGDQEDRRRALEAALGYFPSDKATRFRLEARLAMVDQDTGQTASAHGRLERLLELGPRGIDRDLFAWVEVLDARALLGLGRQPDALALFDRVAADSHLEGKRRATAALEAGNSLLGASPREALEEFRRMDGVRGGGSDELRSAILHALVAMGSKEGLTDELGIYLTADEPERGEALLAPAVALAASWNLPGDEARMVQLVNEVAALRPTPGRALSDSLSLCKLSAASRLIQARLRDLIRQKQLSALSASSPNGGVPDVSGLEKQIDMALRRGDPRRCLGLRLWALATFRPGTDFPRDLWEAASYSVRVERASGAGSDGSACDAILDLCDQLPAGNAYWIEGKFLMADRMAGSGDRAGEQAVLNQVLSLSSLSPSYLAPASKRLGRSLEFTGNDLKALQAYQQAETVAAGFPSGVDCLLHAALIHLHLGNFEEASRLVSIMETATPAVVRGSESSEQVLALGMLSRTGRASECWEAGRKWWPDWESLERAFGRTPAAPEERHPVIADRSRFVLEARRLAESGDRAGFARRLAILLSASRWDPSLGPEAAALASPAIGFWPEQGEALRNLMIEVLQGPHPDGIPNQRMRRLFLASNYLNAKMPGKALTLAEEFDEPGSRPDLLTPAMHQVRGLAAVDADRGFAAAAACLEADLADPASGAQRAMADGILAKLYGKMGLDAKARAFLASEIASPALASNPKGRADLEAQLAMLSGPKAGPAGQGSAATPSNEGRGLVTDDGSSAQTNADWIKSLSLPWYAFATPYALDSSDPRTLDDEVRNPERFFAEDEEIKFLLLAAQDPLIGPADRRQALREATMELLLSRTSYPAMASVASSALAHPAFDDEARLRILWAQLSVLAAEGRGAEYAECRKNPICQHFSDSLRKRLVWLDREAGLDQASPAAVSALAEDVRKEELDASGLQVMSDLFGLLVRVGCIDGADGLVSGSASWHLTPEANGLAAAARMDMDRRLRAARAVNPIHEAMRASLIASYPKISARMPEGYSDARLRGRVSRGLRAPAFDACLFLARNRQFERDDLGFWGGVFASAPRDAGGAAAMGALLRAGLDACPDDEHRSELIVTLFSSADIDDPRVRSEAERAFGPFRLRERFPKSYLAIRLYEIHRDLRLGVPVDLETAYGDLDDPRIGIVRNRDRLMHFLLTGDKTALRRTVSAMDSSSLLSPGFVQQSMPAFALLGMDSELSEAKAAALRYLRRDIQRNWVLGDSSSADSALDLALAMGDPAALPRDWVRALRTGSRDPFLRERAGLVEGILTSDWTAVAVATADLNRDFPSAYSNYWYRGLALHHLGRDSEAAAPLSVFLGVANDDPNFQSALALSRHLAGASGAIPGTPK